FQLAQSLDVRRFELPEALAPQVDRLITDPVLPGNLGHRCTVRFPQDLHHLFSLNRLFFMASSSPGSHPLKNQLVRKSPSRSQEVAPKLDECFNRALIAAHRTGLNAHGATHSGRTWHGCLFLGQDRPDIARRQSQKFDLEGSLSPNLFLPRVRLRTPKRGSAV